MPAPPEGPPSAQPTQESISSTNDNQEQEQQQQLPNDPTHGSHGAAQPDAADSPENNRFHSTTLSPEEMTILAKGGIDYFRSEFQQMGLHLNPGHPSIPPFKESASIRAAKWRAAIASLYPNLGQVYLDNIESKTETGMVYGFLGMHMSSPEPRLHFRADTHPASPSP